MTRRLCSAHYGALAAALAIFFSAQESVATTIFQLQNVSNTAEGEAYDHDFHGNGPDTGDVTVSGNPALLALDAGEAHGELSASFAVSDSVLSAHGSASGNAHLTPGSSAVAGGQATFSASQDFGNDTVQIHITGTLTRDESDAADPSTVYVSLYFGQVGYSAALGSGDDGVLNFDDTLTVSGPILIYLHAFDQPYNGYGYFTGGETYDVTMTILPVSVPEPGTLIMAVLGLVGLGLVNRLKSRLDAIADLAK